MNNNEENKIKIKRLIALILIILGIIGLVFGLYYGLGFNNKFSTTEAIKEHILAFGNLSKVIFVLINYVQTTLIPISNIPTILAGKFIFGPFQASILTFIGVFFGSLTTFAFGKLFGKKAIYWIFGQERIEKYMAMAKGREKLVIFLMLLLPGFPDDIICIIAGITNMSWLFYILAVLFTRSIPIFMTAYLGEVIPFSGWGIAIWAVIFIAFILLGGYVFKKWDNIVSFVEKIKQKIFKKQTP